jgi:DNA-binding NtrC family response regulator
VRELENAIERALALSDNDRLTASDFDFLDLEARPFVADSLLPGAVQQQLSLRQLEEHYIHEILELKEGDRAAAARVLGIDRRTLSRRLADTD